MNKILLGVALTASGAYLKKYSASHNLEWEQENGKAKMPLRPNPNFNYTNGVGGLLFTGGACFTVLSLTKIDTKKAIIISLILGGISGAMGGRNANFVFL